MNRTFVDYNGRTKYAVGDIIPERILSQLTRSVIQDVENTIATVNSGDIQIYRKDREERGYHMVGWSLACQTHFYIVDDEGKILFSSGSYTTLARANSDCEFYNELREFINNGWQGPESTEVLLNDDEDFIIQGYLNKEILELNIYKTIRINYIKSMKIYLVDLYDDVEVGENFNFRERNYSCRCTIEPENEIVSLQPDKHDISSYFKLPDGARGERHASWGLGCQLHFAVIAEDGTVLFSAKDYSISKRRDSKSEFYVKFQEFINNGWTLDGPAVLLSDEDDFIV